MAEKKEKQYVSDNAQLMAEWNLERNTDISPLLLTLGSHKKVWWKCSKGHEWQTALADRSRGTGCPYCSNNKSLEGYNDLKTINPTLAEDWHYEKNGDLKPTDVTPNSSKKVWWKCDNGHEWQAKISHRNNGIGCPYCAGKVVLRGINDLYTVNPRLAKEWHYERNGKLTPMDVMPASGRKAWWKCSKGHEWQAVIASRNKGIGCPFCNTERQTSFPEYALIYYLKKCGIKAIHSYRELGYELDVYIPSRKIAIEYDGHYWHKDKIKNDLEKNIKCKKDGIALFRIREDLPPLNDSSIDYIIPKNQKSLQTTLNLVLSAIIGTVVDVNLKRDDIDIENLREYSEKEKSILLTDSEISKEWNYGKNGKLKPENYTPYSNKKVWWICKKGHEWLARVADRTKGYGCPYCSGRCSIESESDLQTVNPCLAKEWLYEKNGKLTPADVRSGSHKKVWWKCNSGHEWQASIKHRNDGSGCPYCSGRRAINGSNDLQTMNPNLAKEWDYEKNNGLTPVDMMPNSGKIVWWRCKKGHHWLARVADRTKGGGCPYCSGKKVLAGYNDLETVNPSLTKEWHPTKNSNLKPTNVTANSHKKAWWLCESGHEWLAEIGSRNRGNGCPYCSGRKKQHLT